MAGCISDCDSFAKRQFDDLEPGGYLEIKNQAMRFESDDESHTKHSFNEWGDFWEKVGSKLNRSLTIVQDGSMEEAMKRAGFTNIETLNLKMPVGTWPKDKRLKETGRHNRNALDWDLEGFVLRAATQVVEWSYEEAIHFATPVPATSAGAGYLGSLEDSHMRQFGDGDHFRGSASALDHTRMAYHTMALGTSGYIFLGVG
ncbi:uncharacterized protein AUP68_02523 [Ilyonectria robusta]